MTMNGTITFRMEGDMTNSKVNEKKVVADLQSKYDRSETREEREHILAVSKLLNVTIKSDELDTDNNLSSICSDNLRGS